MPKYSFADFAYITCFLLINSKKGDDPVPGIAITRLPMKKLRKAAQTLNPLNLFTYSLKKTSQDHLNDSKQILPERFIQYFSTYY
jgi:hypothetical protein